ncbi:hypothetical protein BH23PLA1_BH23PLA1_11130 [soil metagenome]
MDDQAAIFHCIDKIRDIVTRNEPDRRSILQLGYNLGRLSELAGLGRDLWDHWKGPVDRWDNKSLNDLVQKLQHISIGDHLVRPPKPSSPQTGNLLPGQLDS